MSYNNKAQTLSVSFSTAFAAVCIGYQNSFSDGGDGAPKLRSLGTTTITTNTGYNTTDSSESSFFIAIGK